MRRSGGDGKEGNAGYEKKKGTHNVHIGQDHFPFEGPCGLRVTEVEVIVRWISQPPPGAELVVAVTSSAPSSSVLRLRSITSPVESCAS